MVEAHPQLRHPRHAVLGEDGAPFDPRAFVDAELQYLRTMSEGMAGMVHANDVRIAEGLRDIELPADPERGAWRPGTARSTTPSSTWHREAGPRRPRPQRPRGARASTSRWATASRTGSCCPMYSSASSYRFRPLGPEETLMEIWSLTRFPEGEEPGRPHAARGVGVRRPALAADPHPGLLEPAPPAAGPARQGLRVHALLRAGRGPPRQPRADRSTASSPACPTSALLPALREVNVNPLERPIVDLGL